jgi:hypothetical protein
VRLASVLVFLSLSAAALGADSTVYFPGQLDSEKTNRYASAERGIAQLLSLLKEPPICCESVAPTRTFRFTWLRTFHRPIAFRLEEQPDGHWVLYTKASSGAGGYDWGALNVNEKRAIPTRQAQAVVEKLDRGTKFWSLPVSDDLFGSDRATWIIESRSGDAYHYVYRWSPKEGEVRDIGLAFIALSNLRDEKVY